jgi:hypothetical protein
MIARRICLTGVLAGLAVASSGRLVPAQSIRVGENFRVATGLERRPLVEPHIVAHPRDPMRLLAATIVADVAGEDVPAQTCATFFSEDGGRSWTHRQFAITHCFDPWVAITPGGDAVFAALGGNPGLANKGRGLLVFHSSDGGLRWDQRPVLLGSGRDHPTIAVDSHTPERRDWVYVASTEVTPNAAGRLRFNVTVARSRDGGRTFDSDVRVVPSNLNLNSEQLAVLSDGSIVVSFVDTQRRPLGGFSEDGGDLERRRSWVLRSTDGARTFSVPLFATEACAMGWTAMTADGAAGPHRDRIYFSCAEKGSRSLVVTSSGDSAETWTDPVSVNGPDKDSVTRSQPAVAVNRHGALGISWIEMRRVPSDLSRWCYQVVFSASLDGGKSFLSPQVVSAGESCPSPAANGAAYYRWPLGGDYFGITAAADGRFHLLWSDAREGLYQLWTAAAVVEQTAK